MATSVARFSFHISSVPERSDSKTSHAPLRKNHGWPSRAGWYARKQFPVVISTVQKLFGYQGPEPSEIDPDRIV